LLSSKGVRQKLKQGPIRNGDISLSYALIIIQTLT
jgi:hypothetical protein